MSRTQYQKWLLVIAITLVGTVLRLYKIDALPPGETYDPAYYGLDALAILRGEMPIYFESNHGREPLFSYLVAACVAILGVGSTAIHVASAVVGIITVPAVYLAAEALFAGEQGLLRKYAAPVAALATAISFWHLSWSRYGVRAILTPLFAALTVLFLWRGVRSRRWQAFAGCGFVIGLGMYTYQACCLQPALAAVGFVFAIWRNRSWDKKALLHLAVMVLTALLVFAPLGAYYLTHTGSGLVRVKQVNVLHETDPLNALQEQLKKTVLVFGIEGDAMPTTNLPGRPALNPFFFAALVLGIAISLWRIRQPHFFMLLAWLGIMSVPGVLAQHGETAKRIIGSLPAVTILIAVGLLVPAESIRRWVAQKGRHRRASIMVPGVASMVLVAGFGYSSLQTYQDYFVTWGEDPALFTHFEAGLAAIGQYIASLPKEEQVYVSPVYVGHPSIAYNSQERSDITGYHGDYCLILPYETERDATYIIVPGEDHLSLDKLRTYLPQGTTIANGPLHYQQPYFVSYRVPASAQAQIKLSHQLETNWANQIQLLGYDIAYDEDKSQVSIRLYYRALEAMDTDYTAFLQLVGPQNPKTGSTLWSQRDSEPCRRYLPTSTWHTGEIIIDNLNLTIPNNLVSNETYELIMGFYDWKTMERLPVLDKAEHPVSDHLVLEQRVFRQ